MGDEAPQDALGDGEGEGDEHDGQEGGQAVLQLREVDGGDAPEHRGPDQDQHGRGGVGGHHPRQRRHEEAGQEAQRGEDRGQPRAPAGVDARGALDVGRARRRPEQPRAERGQGIHDQALLQVHRVPVLVQHVRGLGHPDQGGEGVEEVGEHHGDDGGHQGQAQRAPDVELQEHALEVRRAEEPRGDLHHARDHGHRRHREDPGQERERVAPRGEPEHHRQPQDHEQRPLVDARPASRA